jgi:hypothetical protein
VLENTLERLLPGMREDQGLAERLEDSLEREEILLTVVYEKQLYAAVFSHPALLCFLLPDVDTISTSRGAILSRSSTSASGTALIEAAGIVLLSDVAGF